MPKNKTLPDGNYLLNSRTGELTKVGDKPCGEIEIITNSDGSFSYVYEPLKKVQTQSQSSSKV